MIPIAWLYSSSDSIVSNTLELHQQRYTRRMKSGDETTQTSSCLHDEAFMPWVGSLLIIQPEHNTGSVQTKMAFLCWFYRPAADHQKVNHI